MDALRKKAVRVAVAAVPTRAGAYFGLKDKKTCAVEANLYLNYGAICLSKSEPGFMQCVCSSPGADRGNSSFTVSAAAAIK